jgi:predicted DNA-binding ribbon-helix-helix protein
MYDPDVHVVQLRLTDDEWNHIAAIARLRELTIEELLREELRMSRRQADPPPRARSHLRLVARGIDAEPRSTH